MLTQTLLTPGRILRLSVGVSLALLIAVAGTLPVAAASAPYLVKNIKAGSDSSTPFEITALGEIVVFTASGGGSGRELWRSDGTRNGTYQVLDIRPGGKSSNPRGLSIVGDRIFFSANDGTHGQELWVTDGTPAGTHLVKDIAPGKQGSAARGAITPIAVDAAGLAYFTVPGDGRLWRSDGTDAGTFAVPGSPTGLTNLTAFGSRVYFGAQGNLWRSDGTADGTRKAKSNSGATINEPAEIVATDDLVFFQFRSSRLWRTDGTQAGTFKILDNGVGCSYNCDPMRLARAGDLVYFTPLGTPGIQVWRSDGTAAGTFSVAETGASGSDMFTAVGDRMYINVGQLWVSDGSVAGTSQLDLPDGMSVVYVFDVAGDPFYSAFVDGDPLPRLFATDGTPGGTVQVGPPSPGWPLELTVAGDQVIFRGRDFRGDELWAMTLY